MRPIVMTFVMLAPTLFWGYVALDMIGPSGLRTLPDNLIVAFGVLVLALLSLWLTVTFALIAYQNWQQRA